MSSPFEKIGDRIAGVEARVAALETGGVSPAAPAGLSAEEQSARLAQGLEDLRESHKADLAAQINALKIALGALVKKEVAEVLDAAVASAVDAALAAEDQV